MLNSNMKKQKKHNFQRKKKGGLSSIQRQQQQQQKEQFVILSVNYFTLYGRGKDVGKVFSVTMRVQKHSSVWI